MPAIKLPCQRTVGVRDFQSDQVASKLISWKVFGQVYKQAKTRESGTEVGNSLGLRFRRPTLRTVE